MGLEGRLQIVDRREKLVQCREQSVDGLRGQLVIDDKIVEHRSKRVAGGTQRVEHRWPQRVDGRSQSVDRREKLIERRVQMGLEGRWQIVERRLKRVAGRTQRVECRWQNVQRRAQRVEGKLNTELYIKKIIKTL